MLANKSLKITLILTFFSVLANAQIGKDSLYFFNQDIQQINRFLFAPTFSNNNQIKSYGLLNLDFKKESGGFRRAQEAYTISSPRFYAQGFNVLGKFRVAGSFEFNNSVEDSLANGQKNNLEDFTTYYPYANKSGRYKRQNYIAKTSISYSLLNNVIVPFFGLDYHKHQSSGTVDPRLSSNRFIFKLKPGVNLNFKNHSLGIYGLWGKADEQVSLGYKNDNFKTSLLYPDRIHYMQYGYGSSRIKDSSSVFKYDNYKGIGIQFATAIQSWHGQLSAEYESYKNKNYDRNKTAKGFTPYGLFLLNTINSSLLLSRKAVDNSQQIAVDFTYNEGYDGNLKTSGSLNRVNYRVNSKQFNIDYLYLWDKHKKNAKELGFNFSYNQNSKQDFAQANSLAYEQLKFGLRGTWYYTINQQNRLKLNLSPYYTTPLKTTLRYNSNSMTEFIRNVVFTDYYYFDSKTMGALFSSEYISSSLIQNQQFGFYFKLDYQNQLKQDLRNDLNPTFVPNGYRSLIHIGINMYL